MDGKHCVIPHKIKTKLELFANFLGYKGEVRRTSFFLLKLFNITENNAINCNRKFDFLAYNGAYLYCSIFKCNVATLGHQSTEEGEETFSDTTHGCSFSVMFIICFMVKNGSSVLMVLGVLYRLNALVSLQL